MPFTISHAVLAPIISKATKNHLPIAALAIGCMTPDLYRLFTQKHFFEPHQWQSIFSLTLWIGLAFCLVWYVLYRPALYRFLGMQDPLNLWNFKRILKFIVMNIIAVVIGICTHLTWDGLTHADFRTFILRDFLSQNISLMGHQYPMHRILQIGTSALALPFVIWMSWDYYCRNQQHIKIAKTVRYYGIGLFLLSLALGLFSFFDYIRHIPAQYFQSGLYHITGSSINEFTQGFLITFTLGCILFLFLDRDRRLG